VRSFQPIVRDISPAEHSRFKCPFYFTKMDVRRNLDYIHLHGRTRPNYPYAGSDLGLVYSIRMQTFLRLMAILCLVLASGCGGHIQELSRESSFDEGGKTAIIVLRVTTRAWVVLVRGKFDRYGWKAKGVLNRRPLWSEDGFVAAEVTPTGEDEGYAIVEIRPERYSSRAQEPAFTYATALWSQLSSGVFMPIEASAIARALEGPTYFPKGEAHLPVFSAVAGQVTYVGAIRIDASKDPESDDPPEKIGVTPVPLSGDAEAVARFMAKHYPNVHATVSTRLLQMMRWNQYMD